MTAVSSELPDDTAAFVRRHVGTLSNVSFCGWDHGVSDVWDRRNGDDRRVFVKSCRDKYKRPSRSTVPDTTPSLRSSSAPNAGIGDQRHSSTSRIAPG